ITAWMLSLVGIESDNIFIKLLKPSSFSPILALIGVVMTMMAKSNKKKDIGYILIGFAVLMYGMEFMSDAVEPLKDMPEFTSILTAFTNPFLGILTGMVLTAIIQSSSASVGILQALSLTGSITYGMALPIIMGQNIGTCVTSLISSIGVSKNAKKVAVVHISFNMIGTIIFTALYCVAHYMIELPILQTAITPVNIAIIHSIFNISTTVILLPFSKVLVTIANTVIKDDEEEPEKQIAFLDERLLKTPSIALQELTDIAYKMADVTKKSIYDAMELLFDYDEEKGQAVKDLETEVDIYEDKLGSYLVRLSGHDLSDVDSAQVSKLLHAIGDLERISDHAVNIMEAGKEMQEKGLRISDQGIKEIKVATKAIAEILDISIEAFKNNDLELAYRVEPLEECVDDLIDEIKLSHIHRLKDGHCTIEHGFVLSDILTNYERVSDHCSNIGVAMIELAKGIFDAHEYLDALKIKEDPEFKRMYEEYKAKYALN
ncbi:MAG: Na/Pi cotransporter family protein, partial [Firmicutes bacterium]|nr:Na/Pi cotransporter family protein [Bacillota bacterium]